MVERFFSARQTDLLNHNQSDQITLLSGPPSCGKTSLLFQFAFNSASHRQPSRGVHMQPAQVRKQTSLSLSGH
ncbi:hypothetical protein SLA2020_365290 [Shorea laevis]